MKIIHSLIAHMALEKNEAWHGTLAVQTTMSTTKKWKPCNNSYFWPGEALSIGVTPNIGDKKLLF